MRNMIMMLGFLVIFSSCNKDVEYENGIEVTDNPIGEVIPQDGDDFTNDSNDDFGLDLGTIGSSNGFMQTVDPVLIGTWEKVGNKLRRFEFNLGGTFAYTVIGNAGNGNIRQYVEGSTAILQDGRLLLKYTNQNGEGKSFVFNYTVEGDELRLNNKLYIKQ